MSAAQAQPLAELGSALDRLAFELAASGDLEGHSPEHFQCRVLPILAALHETVKAARVALEPAMAEEHHRAIAGNYWRDHYRRNPIPSAVMEAHKHDNPFATGWTGNGEA
ncbi:hypothetical protein [Novosphingobium sp. PASSN1]|uniref:hypothetical protein n=1 Tax=Novosphingobium sp. PASSN1 TaxID=2015561 RepID=UPI000BC9EA6D|nr:hypothetical protein [Novosphingobium sp. PASSN1]OYU37046.1 MAG: hypothetical protein CFE35_01295 [Novosphingobium sp. PASSN1]